jgi:hypothetical protein
MVGPGAGWEKAPLRNRQSVAWSSPACTVPSGSVRHCALSFCSHQQTPALPLTLRRPRRGD